MDMSLPPAPSLTDIERHMVAVRQLCQRYGVQRLALFGSATTPYFDPANSDFDFVVQFANTHAPDYPDRYLDFAEALEDLFQRPVDLLTNRAIRDPQLRAEILRTQRVTYEAPAR